MNRREIIGTTTTLEVVYADDSKGSLTLECMARLGSGRAARVYQVRDIASGRLYAEKVFNVGHDSPQLVRDALYRASFQAPSPYRTKENAVRAALFRRKVLRDLTEFWFGEPRVADALYTRWDDEAKAYILGTEYIDGRGPRPGPVNPHSLRYSLYNYFIRPFRKIFTRLGSEKKRGFPWEIGEAMTCLDEFKAKFHDAGFLGSEWQVDKSLSVPTSNLLRNGSNQWILADVESAMPALALPEYVWRAVRYGSFPLFDDVDFARLNKYLSDNHKGLVDKLGEVRAREMFYYVQQLDHYTRVWKESEPAIFSHGHRLITDSRLREGIRLGYVEYWRRKGQITDEKAMELQGSQLLFLRYMILDTFSGVFSAFGSFFRYLGSFVSRTARAFVASLRFVYSAFFREAYLHEVARSYVLGSIDKWQRSGRLSEEEADGLKQDIESPAACEYINGFVAHLGLQLLEPPIIGNAALVALAVLLECPEILAAIFISPVLRSLYTLYRSIKNRGKGISYRYAFIVGALPKVGVFAYCVQMASTYPDLSVFLPRYQASRIGRHFPLFGGENSRLEHLCLRSLDILASVQYELDNLAKGIKSIATAVRRSNSGTTCKGDGVHAGFIVDTPTSKCSKKTTSDTGSIDREQTR